MMDIDTSLNVQPQTLENTLVQLEETPTSRAKKKKIIQSAYLVNSIHESTFPSTDVYMHPENQSWTPTHNS